MEFTTLKIAGKDAVPTLNDHRRGYPATGLYPFLIGDAVERDRLLEMAGFNRQDPAAILKASRAIDPADWLAGQRERAEEDDELSPEEIQGEWPGEIVDKGGIGLHKDVLGGEFLAEVYLGLARIEEPWHLPAAVKFGSWNGCPSPEEHCALHRAWQDRYGAEITGISGDVVECRVAKPPADRDAALQLAWEQYGYCPDLVDQGCGSVSTLAAILMNSPYWYFWWD